MSTLRRTPARIALTLALPLLALAAATPAHAKRSGWSIDWTLDLSAGAARMVGVPGVPTPPQAAYFGGGLSIGLPIGDSLLLGASLDYRMYEQYSSPDSYGNQRGSQLALAAPFLALRFGETTRLTATAYVMGDYLFANLDPFGNALALRQPMGGRLEFRFGFIPRLHLGIFVEHIQYASQTSGSTTTALSPAAFIQQAGLALHLPLGAHE